MWQCVLFYTIGKVDSVVIASDSGGDGECPTGSITCTWENIFKLKENFVVWRLDLIRANKLIRALYRTVVDIVLFKFRHERWGVRCGYRDFNGLLRLQNFTVTGEVVRFTRKTFVAHAIRAVALSGKFQAEWKFNSFFLVADPWRWWSSDW